MDLAGFYPPPSPLFTLVDLAIYEYVLNMNGSLINICSAMRPCQHVVCAKSANKSVLGRRVQPMTRIVRTRQPQEMAVICW